MLRNETENQLKTQQKIINFFLFPQGHQRTRSILIGLDGTGSVFRFHNSREEGWEQVLWDKNCVV